MDAATFTARLLALGCAVPKALTLPATYITSEHTHPYDAHVLVTAGEFVVTTPEARHVMTAGDNLILAAETPHSEVVGPQGAALLVAAVYQM